MRRYVGTKTTKNTDNQGPKSRAFQTTMCVESAAGECDFPSSSSLPSDRSSETGVHCLFRPLEHEALSQIHASAMTARIVAEGWDERDILAAHCQASLLSHRSSFEGTTRHGERYVDRSGPEFYKSNAPWNDWVPPSESRRRFLEAAATPKSDRVACRVRVGLCLGPEKALESIRHGHKLLIAFVSVEVSEDGSCQALVLRRGADTIATLALGTTRALKCSANPLVVILTTESGHVDANSACLCFEDNKRLKAFEAMFPGIALTKVCLSTDQSSA